MDYLQDRQNSPSDGHTSEKNKFHISKMSELIRKNNIQGITDLLEHGYEPTEDEVIDAYEHQNLDIIRLLDEASNNTYVDIPENNVGLSDAIRHNRVKLVEYFIQKGQRPDRYSLYNCTNMGILMLIIDYLQPEWFSDYIDYIAETEYYKLIDPIIDKGGIPNKVNILNVVDQEDYELAIKMCQAKIHD